MYIVKLLHTKKDILQRNIPILFERNPWVKNYIEGFGTVNTKESSFAFINDPSFDQAKELFPRHMGKMDDFFKDTFIDPLKRFGGLIKSIESTYFKSYMQIPD